MVAEEIILEDLVLELLDLAAVEVEHNKEVQEAQILEAVEVEEEILLMLIHSVEEEDLV